MPIGSFKHNSPSSIAGLLRCSRYSFGPNRLHYCGPDKNIEILESIRRRSGDQGLAEILSQFQTLFHYLAFISHSNGITDPFDDRVVSAYWIGNALLSRIDQKKFYRHLLETLDLRRRISTENKNHFIFALKNGAVPHHSFHVFNVGTRTGHIQSRHTLSSMDSCRVSWGCVQKIDGHLLNVLVQPLGVVNGFLTLTDPVIQTLIRPFSIDDSMDEIQTGQWISIHWGVPCEILSSREVACLKRATEQSLWHANQTNSNFRVRQS